MTREYSVFTLGDFELTMQEVLTRLRIRLDEEDCAANGWQYLPLESGLYDA